MAMLEVRDLSVRYEPKLGRPLTAVNGVSFDVEPGEFVGLIGESGSGKSTLGTAVLRMIQPPGKIVGGTVKYQGRDLVTMDDDELRKLRWHQISTVFQSSMNSLNPVIRIEKSFRDIIEEHTELRDDAVTAHISNLLEMVLIDPKFMNNYPHELSGGMKQRVNLALAMALNPKFVLLDEPTTGLDMVVQKTILDAIRDLQSKLKFGVLFISHDMGTVLEMSDRIMVMYAGKMAEVHPTSTLLRNTLHPYTKGMLGSFGDPRAEVVKITYVPGRPPDLTREIVGCPFAPRCPERVDVCLSVDPVLTKIGDAQVSCHVAVAKAKAEIPQLRGFAGPSFVKTLEDTNAALKNPPIITVKNVSRVFTKRQGFRSTKFTAVDDVSFTLQRGVVTTLVGQSGSGKTTLAKMITAVDKPTSGEIIFHGDSGDQVVAKMNARALRLYHRNVQMVFQDPYASLNPTRSIAYILTRPLINHLKMKPQEAEERAIELLNEVGLTPAVRFMGKFPFEMSGGQRQRVVIARALAPNPKLIVADEPIASLDVSIRAEILKLLDNLVKQHDCGILYITHDLLSARMLADNALVLDGGKLMESGRAIDVITNPQDEYTRKLLEAIPNPFADIPAA
ncbi:MAG: ABC transporter ATP-binding protein [Candidatus Nanopelagicales bacterium]